MNQSYRLQKTACLWSSVLFLLHHSNSPMIWYIFKKSLRFFFLFTLPVRSFPPHKSLWMSCFHRNDNVSGRSSKINNFQLLCRISWWPTRDGWTLQRVSESRQEVDLRWFPVWSRCTHQAFRWQPELALQVLVQQRQPQHTLRHTHTSSMSVLTLTLSLRIR